MVCHWFIFNGFFDTTGTLVLQTNKKISIANLIQQVALCILEMKMIAADVNMISFRNATERDVITVKTLITHTCQGTVQAMGWRGLWVGGGGKKISAQEI